MFFFRLNKITIFDNREGKKFLLFGKSRAEVKIMSFVSTEFTQMPDLSELSQTTDSAKQKALLEKAITAVVASRVLTTVENVRDNQKLTFGDAGFVVFQSNAIPSNFDWLLLVMEEDRDIREGAALVQDIMNHRDFKTFSKQLIVDLAVAANPAFAAAMKISKFAVNVLTDRGKKNKDDQIGLLYMSLNRAEHYPFGERKRDDVPDLTQNMLVDYSLFGVEYAPPKKKPAPKKTAATKSKTTAPKKTTTNRRKKKTT